MRPNRILKQMAGIVESPYQKMMKRHQREIDRRSRLIAQEALLVEMISRRQKGADGAAPMPFKAMRDDLAKMAKGEL